MAHGYARDYDEPIDRGDDDRGRRRDENRDRGFRGSGGEWSNRDRDWGGEHRDLSERNRNFMLGDRDRSWQRDDNRDRGFSGQTGSQARSWFRDDDRQYRGTHEDDWQQRNRAVSQSGSRGDWERSPRDFSSHQDDHYRSWRNRQMEALDRDYEDYCRDREQQFHRDFDSWRQNRQQGGNSSTKDEIAQEAERERSHERALAGQGNTPSPVGAATLGTNNSENTGTGRAKPSV